MTKWLIYLGMICGNFLLYAQANQLSGSDQRLEIRLFQDSSIPDTEKVEGSPYLDEDFQEAKINDRPNSYLVRYNVFNDNMQVKITDGNILILNNEARSYTITFNNKGRVYETVTFEKEGVGYAQLVWQGIGGSALYVKQIIKYTPSRENSTGYGQSFPARYTRGDDIFYIKKNEAAKLIEVPSNQGKFFKQFGPDLKEYVKKNSLDIRIKEDLISIMSYYFDRLN